MLGAKHNSDYKGGGASCNNKASKLAGSTDGSKAEGKGRICNYCTKGDYNRGEHCPFAHVCGLLLGNGKKCIKRHKAKDHDPAKDGKWPSNSGGKRGRGRKGNRK